MQHKPSDYRMMAAMCVEIANGMSLDTDRLRLTDRAQEWLELAQKHEAEQLPKIADGGSVQCLESQTRTDGKSFARADFGAKDLKMADDAGLGTVIIGGTPQFGQSTSSGERRGHRPDGSRSPRAARAWSMLCNVLLLMALALFLTALFAGAP